MKVQNIRNLNTAIKQKEMEIEITKDMNNAVVKAGMLSKILFSVTMIAMIGIAIGITSIICYFTLHIQSSLIVSILALCVLIFALVMLICVKVMTKIPITTSLRLRKYSLLHNKDRILLKKN